jgi:hypothetical protein
MLTGAPAPLSYGRQGEAAFFAGHPLTEPATMPF